MIRRPPKSPLFPYPTLSRSEDLPRHEGGEHAHRPVGQIQDARGAIDEHDAERREREDAAQAQADDRVRRDRKSTRLNSSHLVISYAVFCLKKKKRHWRKYWR